MKTFKTAITICSFLITAISFAAHGNTNPVRTEKGKTAESVSLSVTSLSQMDSTSDYKKFKKEAENKISENERSIAKMRSDMAEENKTTRDKYNERINKIEQKNKDLKKKIETYKEENNNPKWNAFKRDFTKSMDELGQSIKDIFKDYKK